MKNLFIGLFIILGLGSCASKKEVKLIPLTSTSKEAIENFLNYKACEIVIIIENSGWQTKAKGSYKGSESDEILQEYKFETNVEAGEFCKLATELFSSKGHHPDKFIWKDTRVLVSLTSHSAGGITDKDWEVASELDRIYTK